MLFEQELRIKTAEAIKALYEVNTDINSYVINPTRKEFEGDLTLVVFGIAKSVRKAPDQAGNEIGEWLKSNVDFITAYNCVKGFLNLSVTDIGYVDAFNQPAVYENTLSVKEEGPVLVEYSSPNTNKPLHLGHLRNILIGHSISTLLKANGHAVEKVNLVNDRGIHICKSMLAWIKLGNGETPESGNIKGDHLAGKYYVEFDRMYKAEIAELVAGGMPEEEAKKKAPSLTEAQEMLLKWESGDEETVRIWSTMNGWVYKGFDETYKMIGVTFDRTYYESQTYLLGKSIVNDGLEKGVFYKKDDGSVWVDLTADGLDEKLLLRGDGTSVYITQDLGTARQRFEEYNFSKLIYVVGNEQDYHFKVLRLILKKMGYSWWDRLHHLSYNMVDLPSGKMKSREGTVVDADELMAEMISEAKRITTELGKTGDLDGDKASDLFQMIGLGALKYFILKVDPEKRMIFNPAESIDFNGHTGPFIQYTYARIQSVLRKGKSIEGLWKNEDTIDTSYQMLPKERELLKLILSYRDYLQESSLRYSPAVMANYAYELAKTYNQFYHEHVIADSDQPAVSAFRLVLSKRCAEAIQQAMQLLGITVPERM